MENISFVVQIFLSTIVLVLPQLSDVEQSSRGLYSVTHILSCIPTSHLLKIDQRLLTSQPQIARQKPDLCLKL